MSTYTLKKDHYSSGLHFGVHFGINHLQFKVNFSKECLYQPIDWENDYNKLIGWSYGLHHKNSIRVCWRPYVTKDTTNPDYYMPSKIELCIYVYENGIRKISEKTIIVDIDTEYNFTIAYFPENKYIIFHDNEINSQVTMSYTSKIRWGYYLYPYFGGNNPAPHDMSIQLERL